MLALVMVLAIAPVQHIWADGVQQENQQPGEGRPGEPQHNQQPGMPPQGATQTIQLRVEGDAAGTDELAALVMVSLDNGANYKPLKELASDANSKVQKNGSSYEFDSAVTSIMAYLTDEAGRYMLQTPVQIGKNNAVRINAGQTFIQIDKVRYTVTWAYDAKRYGEDAYLEHGTAKNY